MIVVMALVACAGLGLALCVPGLSARVGAGAIALGAFVSFGIHLGHARGFGANMIGLMLMIAGLVGILAACVVASRRGPALSDAGLELLGD